MKRAITILTVILFGCQAADDIPFDTGKSKYVVEAWLTDEVDQQYVRISQTVPFTSVKRNEIIPNAEVEILETGTGSINRFSFTYVENGYYSSNSTFAGVGGRSYTLRIELPDGRTIQSLTETMTEIMPIDTLGYDFFTRESEDDPNTDLMIYYPVAWTSDPPDTQNFYRWKLYKNDTLFSAPEEIFLFSDRFLDKNKTSYPQEFIGYEYRLNDTIRVERLSISQGAFEFLEELKAQTTTLGTNTAVSPASVTGNLFFVGSNESVLGFFGTVAITSNEIVITN